METCRYGTREGEIGQNTLFQFTQGQRTASLGILKFGFDLQPVVVTAPFVYGTLGRGGGGSIYECLVSATVYIHVLPQWE